MKRKNRIEEYCETTFNALKANVHNWGKPEYARPISRIYYYGVFDCGDPNPTGLISENALYNKMHKLKTVKDHYLSPQFVGRMILDNPQIYLEDYEQFREIFIKCTHTILVTQAENENLSSLTKNTDGEYTVYIPTNLKYNHSDIKLYKREKNFSRWNEENCIPLESNILDDVPVELLEYEKDYLVKPNGLSVLLP